MMATQLGTVDDVRVEVRDVTDEEVEQYFANGWVFLPGLIPSETARAMLAVAKELMGELGDVDTKHREPVRATAFQTFRTFDEHEPHARELVRNPTLGRNMARLIGRDGPVRSLTNLLAVKLPRDLETDQPGKGETGWHQDYNTPAMCQSMAVWLALDEITPDMGSMRFRNGSHALGFMPPPVTRWPRAMALPLSDPIHLQPGDATVHHQLVVHSAPENSTDRSRFVYIINYFPGDAPFLPWPNKHTDDILDELEPGKPLDHPRFPLVYEPAGQA